MGQNELLGEWMWVMGVGGGCRQWRSSCSVYVYKGSKGLTL